MKFLPASFLLISLFVLPGLSESQEQKLIPPPEITFPGGYPLSSVSGVLRSIAQARGDIHDNKLQSAGDALNDARLRIEFIMHSLVI